MRNTVTEPELPLERCNNKHPTDRLITTSRGCFIKEVFNELKSEFNSF